MEINILILRAGALLIVFLIFVGIFVRLGDIRGICEVLNKNNALILKELKKINKNSEENNDV